MGRFAKYARVLAPAVAIATGAIALRAQEAPSGQQQEVVQARPDQQPQPDDGRGRFRGRFGRGGPTNPGDPNNPNAAATAPADGAAPATQPAFGTTAQPVTIIRPATTQAMREISLNFREAPVDTVLNEIAKATGYTIIKQGTMEGIRISVVSVAPMSADRAIELLNAALHVNNYAAIQSEHTIKVMPLADAIHANTPVVYVTKGTELPDNDIVVTGVIPLKNVDANKLKTELAPLINPTITADQGANALIMTDTNSNIRRVVQIVENLDNGGVASSDIQVLTLKYASAAQTAKLITTIFKPDSQQNQNNNFPFFGGRGRGGFIGGPGGNTSNTSEVDEALHNGHVNAASDDRTNSIIVIAPKETMTIIQNLVSKLDDNPIPATLIKAFPLKNADAEATTKLLTTLFSDTSGGGGGFIGRLLQAASGADQTKVKVTVAADDRTNTVIVTAPQEAMVEIEKLITNLDANPVANSTLKVFVFKNGSASSAAKLITTTFNPDDTSTSSNNNGGGGGGRGFRSFFQFGGGGGQSNTGSTNRNQKVTAVSDDTTNTLVVTAPADVMKLIDNIVLTLDTNPASEQTMFIYRLRNAQSANLQTVLNTLFGNTTGTSGFGSSTTGNRTGSTGGRSSFGGGGGGLGGGSSGLGGGSSLGGGSTFGNTGSSINRNSTGINGNRLGGNTGGANSSQNRPQTELTGEVYVVADTDTNSLLVTAPYKYKDQVVEIIKSLDRPIAQVLIKVLVAEVTHDNAADFGVDFSILNQRPSGKGLVVGQTLGNTTSYANNGGLAVSLLEGNLQATLHALATQGKLDVLSRPYILASDNQEAVISIGQEVPIVSDVRVTDTGQLIATPTYVQVGISLDVTPHINPDGLVILDVAPTISQLTNSNIQISAGVTSPIFDQRTANSRVGIRNDDTIVIGGLMQDQKTVTVNKIPLLGDIPLVGAVFSRTQVDKTKTELLIFLTPHVALQPGLLQSMSEKEKGTLKLTPNAVDPGVYQEHMNGMRTGEMPQTQPAYPGAENPVTHIPLERPGTMPSQQQSSPAYQTNAPVNFGGNNASPAGAKSNGSSSAATQPSASLQGGQLNVDSRR